MNKLGLLFLVDKTLMGVVEERSLCYFVKFYIMLLFLFFDEREENVEHLLFAVPVVVDSFSSGFILGSSVYPDLNAIAANDLQNERVTQSIYQSSPTM